jgi:hypothetical protein
MMNKSILEKEFESRKISKDAYSLNGGLPNEAFCISFNKGVWEVYYSEKGLKSGLKIFNTEEEACNYLLETVVKNI